MGHPYAGGYAPPAPVRRRRRWPWVLLGVVVVLAGLFVVADRVALSVAENKAATTLQTSQNLSSKPHVSVAGFPFLTQLAAGSFGEITISADAITTQTDPSLRIANVAVHAHDVTVPSDYSSVRVATADADARITYADLSRTLGIAVSDGGNGRLVATPSVTVAGQTFSGTVSAVVKASPDKGISFDDTKVTAGGVTLPSIVSNALGKVFQTVISLKGLPFDVTVDSVAVTSTGIHLALTGHNLVYTKNS